MFCGKCGKEVKEGIAYCPYCGSKLQTVIQEPTTEIKKAKAYINKKY